MKNIVNKNDHTWGNIAQHRGVAKVRKNPQRRICVGALILGYLAKTPRFSRRSANIGTKIMPSKYD